MRFTPIAAAALSATSTVYASPIQARAAPVDELVGYAAGTTGGGSAGNGTTATSCETLAAAAKTGGVIKIKGTLKGCGIIRIPSDTSVLGVGADAVIEGGGFQLKDVSNVIIRNIKFHLPPEKKDLVDIDGSTKVWVDHCDFSSGGLSGSKDTYDGALDAKHGSDMLTFSWNKFHDHWKVSLIGHSDNNAGEDTGKLHVTYHHNHWTKCSSRLPSIRFGTGHIYSSCYIDNPTSGVNSRMGAQVLVEATSFTNTNRAIITNLDSKEEGTATSRDNIFDAKSEPTITKESSLTVPYKYTVDPAAGVCAIVEKSAGVGVVTF